MKYFIRIVKMVMILKKKSKTKIKIEIFYRNLEKDMIKLEKDKKKCINSFQNRCGCVSLVDVIIEY